MAILGKNIIHEYYTKYLNTELNYQKGVMDSLGFQPKTAVLRIQGRVVPCILHSLSFAMAKLIIKLTDQQLKDLKSGSRLCVLKVSYQISGTSEEFTLSGKFQPESLQRLGEDSYLVLLREDFNHRPPEGLIEVQGNYLKLKADSEARKTQRLALTEENLGYLGLRSAAGDMKIDHIPRKCLVKEVSFGGARVLIGGLAKFLDQREFDLSLDTLDRTPLVLPGKIVRAEAVEGHRELSVLGLQYHADRVPVEYLKAVQATLDRQVGNPPVNRPQPTQKKGPSTGWIDTETLKIRR